MENITLKTKDTLGEVGVRIYTQLETQYAGLETATTNNNKGPVYKFIKDNSVDLAVVVQLSHLMITTGVSEGQAFTDLSSAVGKRILNYYNFQTKKDSALHIHLGAFVINAFAILNLVQIRLIKKSFGNRLMAVYYVYAEKRGDLNKLRKEFDEQSDPYKPLLQQAPDWTSGKITTNGDTIKLIKQATTDTLAKINQENTPIVLNAVNKKQKVAYTVRPEMYEVYTWALKTNQSAFEHNSVDTIEFARKAAKRAEAEAVRDAAEDYVGRVFYQQYQADYRGRLYPMSAYLNEVNSDNAKGLLSFATPQALGPTGKDQLFHHIANMFGYDKDDHAGRVKFVQDRYEQYVAAGANPYENKIWMNAEEPFQFLNAIMDLARFDAHVKAGGNPEEYESDVICYRDGSVNGLQHLLALAKDDKHAHLVNIKPTKDGKPGDMYIHMARAVLAKIAEKVGEEKTVAIENYEIYYKTIEMLRNRMRETEATFGVDDIKSQYQRRLVKWYQKRYKDQLKSTDLIYWSKGQENGLDIKDWRKILKRNIMTYGYSSQASGMGQQIIDDTKDIDNKYLSNKQHSAARLLGGLVFKTIEGELKEVASLMNLFKKNCEIYMKKHNKQVSFNSVITNFPFKQNYYKTVKKLLKVANVYVTGSDYKTKAFHTIRLNALFDTDQVDIRKAKLGISPNSIHNNDFSHLAMVVNECEFDIVSAHDSFGCHAGNVVEMQKVIREQFKRLMDAKPVEHMLAQTGNLVDMIETGEYDSADILKSEFAFA